MRVEKSEPLKNELKHFVERVKEGKKPLLGGKEVAQLVKIIEEALRQKAEACQLPWDPK